MTCFYTSSSHVNLSVQKVLKMLCAIKNNNRCTYIQISIITIRLEVTVFYFVSYLCVTISIIEITPIKSFAIIIVNNFILIGIKIKLLSER